MQALNWASAYPRRVFACATVASAARQSAQNIALSELGRQAIMADPDWRGGGYAAHGVRPSKGLAVARMAAQVASLSEAGVRARIRRRATSASASASTRSVTARRARASSSASTPTRTSISRARWTASISPPISAGGLPTRSRAARRGTRVFAFSSDWRYPPEESRALARALIASGAEASFVEIDTPNGHDAYLGEEPEFEADAHRLHRRRRRRRAGFRCMAEARDGAARTGSRRAARIRRCAARAAIFDVIARMVDDGASRAGCRLRRRRADHAARRASAARACAGWSATR